MESGCEAEDRDDCCDFVQEEERGDVGDGRGAKREGVAAEESWEAGFEARDAGSVWWCLGRGEADSSWARVEGAEAMLSEGGEGAWGHGGRVLCGPVEGDGGIGVAEV